MPYPSSFPEKIPSPPLSGASLGEGGLWKKIINEKYYSQVHNILHVYIAIAYPSSYAKKKSLPPFPPKPPSGTLITLEI